MDRHNLTSQVDDLYWELNRIGLGDKAEEILLNNNASDIDGDGFIATMSDTDLENAVQEMTEALQIIEPETVQDMIYSLQSHNQDVSYDYIDGYLDACRMIAEEYNIQLNGL